MAQNQDWTDEKLIAFFRGDEAQRSAALKALYLKPGVREKAVSLVTKYGGTSDHAIDVFQDAIIVADRQLRAGNFQGFSSLNTWILAIVKKIWWAQQQKTDRRQQKDWDLGEDEAADSPEKILIHQERAAALDAALESIGDLCKRLLRLYALRYSMTEIAEALELPNAERAKDKARDCREKLRAQILKNPFFTDLLR